MMTENQEMIMGDGFGMTSWVYSHSLPVLQISIKGLFFWKLNESKDEFLIKSHVIPQVKQLNNNSLILDSEYVE